MDNSSNGSQRALLLWRGLESQFAPRRRRRRRCGMDVELMAKTSTLMFSRERRQRLAQGGSVRHEDKASNVIRAPASSPSQGGHLSSTTSLPPCPRQSSNHSARTTTDTKPNPRSFKIIHHETPPELPDTSCAGGRRLRRNPEPAARDHLVPKVSGSRRQKSWPFQGVETDRLTASIEVLQSMFWRRPKRQYWMLSEIPVVLRRPCDT